MAGVNNNLIPPKKGEVRNPKGKPKGTIHLSTHIQNLLNDEKFEAWIPDARVGVKEYKGAPVKAILSALVIKAMAGDVKAFDALAKYGYGTKLDITSLGEKLETAPLIVSEIKSRGQDDKADQQE
jgi:hypothetical protein